MMINAKAHSWRLLSINLALLFAGCVGTPAALMAQQAAQSEPSGSLPLPPKPTAPAVPSENQPAADPKVQKDDRIFWALPNYLTVENASSLPPMTVAGKFKLIAADTFDPVTFVFVGLEAGVNQATNADPTFRQGLKGYAKRYGLAFSDNAIGNFMSSAVFPAMLHQDPRFYQMGGGRYLHRIWYAGTRVFVTRADSGKSQVNYSEIFGNALAAGISNAYHPGPRTLGSNINVWATQTAWDAVSYEMKEFWPDFHHLVSRRH